VPWLVNAPRIDAIETARLRLRRWCDADREPFAALNADPRVTELLVGPLPRELSDVMIERIEAHFRVNGFGLWALERRDDGALLGFTGVQRVPFEARFTPAVEVGWRLRFDAWGQGYATEAARAAVSDAFRRLGIDEIVAFTVPANHRSQAVMRRLDMRRAPNDDFDHPRLPDGHPLRRHWLFRLNRADWMVKVVLPFNLDSTAGHGGT